MSLETSGFVRIAFLTVQCRNIHVTFIQYTRISWSVLQKLDKINQIRSDLEEMKMYRFLVVIEKANINYSTYSLDLPRCVSTGATAKKLKKNMYEAIEMHSLWHFTNTRNVR